ncbi:MAG: ABC transporter ATP-binding protein [Oscillospiraceae bacterium]|nr:ABC transporter ATP-binding protein [Oscillospiraceae bacterium]
MFQLRWIWRNLKGRRKFMVMGLALSIITMSMVVIIPKLSQILIDDVIIGGQKSKLAPILLVMCGVQLLRTVLRYLMVICLENASQFLVMRIRKHIFTTIINQELKFYDRNRTGDIITRVTGDIEYVRHTCSWISYMFSDSISLLIATIVFLTTIHIGLTLIMLAVTPLIAIISYFYIKRIKSIYRQLRERLSNLNTTAQENIAGNRVVKAFTREDYEIDRFDKCSKEYRAANLSASYKWQMFSPIVDLISQSLTVIMVLAGGMFVMNGSLTYGSLAAFSGLTWALANPMKNLGIILNDLQRFFTSADKVIELFYSKPIIADRHDCNDKADRIKGKITFDNVSFKYNKEPVLKNVSFTITPGETIAIMGSTGSGKTTLVNLIARMYDVTEGRILVDDVDVRMWKLSKLRSSIGLATQDVFLFSDTVDGNISYGNPNLSEKDIEKFAKGAAADSFINKMEDGYNTIIGERGVGLSGGQRQRIALARALAVSPPILVLDDTTSAVDMETEQYIQNQLTNLDFECTKIIIAQRISSVKSADRIFVLNNGSIEIGTHETLMRKSGYYREICELQNLPNLPPIPDENSTEEGGAK